MPWAVEWYDDAESAAPRFRGYALQLTDAIRNCVRQAEAAKTRARDEWESVRDESNIFAPVDP